MTKSTDRHPTISLGKAEMKILEYLSTLDFKDYFSGTRAEDYTHIARTTIYDIIKRLKKKKLADFEQEDRKNIYTSAKITKKGKAVLQSVGTYRRGCRGRAGEQSLRPHDYCFKLKVREFPKDWEDKIVGEITNEYFLSKNNPVRDLSYEDDVKVRVFTSSIMIRPQNIYNEDSYKATEEAYIKALKVIEDLINVGFKIENKQGMIDIRHTDGEYAHVESILGNWFHKRTGRGYIIKDKDGQPKFWIDFSHGKIEDETATEEQRENLDFNMDQMLNREYDFDDLQYKGELALKVAVENTKSLFRMRKMLTGLQEPKIKEKSQLIKHRVKLID